MLADPERKRLADLCERLAGEWHADAGAWELGNDLLIIAAHLREPRIVAAVDYSQWRGVVADMKVQSPREVIDPGEGFKTLDPWDVLCPECGAFRGERCHTGHRNPNAVHRGRIEHAARIQRPTQATQPPA